MIDLYKYITSKYEYNSFKSTVNNKGSSIGKIFKIKVIYRLIQNKNNNNIFYNFIINKSIKVESL